jgi:hypothetical protein
MFSWLKSPEDFIQKQLLHPKVAFFIYDFLADADLPSTESVELSTILNIVTASSSYSLTR